MPWQKPTHRRKPRLTPRQQEAKVRGLAAINRVRKGQSESLSSAARAEGTTVATIRDLLRSALLPTRAGQRVRVRVSDRYSARVEIITDTGPLVTTARGSRERDLAGEHRATAFRVLGRQAPPSALEKFRGKTVGGRELVADLESLALLGRAGVLQQLDTLYASPDSAA
jgi:hypothetical protein